MLNYDRARRDDGLLQIWRTEIKEIEPRIGEIDEDADATRVIIEIVEHAYRKSGTIYKRGEWLRRVTGYRRPPQT